MKKTLLEILIVVIAGFMVVGGVWATFPVSLNNWSSGDTITNTWANNLESTIGITNSADTSSHDYMIRNRLTISFASTTYYIQRDATSTMNYWETQQSARSGDAFSTTTNNYWASQSNISLFVNDSGFITTSDWATTSVNYWLTTKSTSNLTEGTNLYFTNARVDTHLSGGAGITYSLGAISVTADAIGDTQLAFDTGQELTSVANPTFGDLTLTYGLSVATSTFSGALTLINNAIDEADINFTTACASGNRLYISGGNLACESAAGGAADGASNWKYTAGQNALTPTSTVGIIVQSSSTITGLTMADATVTDTFVIGSVAAGDSLVDFYSNTTRFWTLGLDYSDGGAFKITTSSDFSAGIVMSISSSTGAITFNNTYTFPRVDGTNNQILKTDGSGNITWQADATAGAGTDGTSNWKLTVSQNALTPTSTIGINVNASSTFGSTLEVIGAITGSLTGNADTATNLAANGANCTNQFPLGVDTAGAVEGCASVADAFMDYTSVTLADFTNDGDYQLQAFASTTYVIASSWISIDNYPTGCTNQFVTTIGDTLTCASVNSADIATGAVKDDEMDYTQVTLSDFLNDADYQLQAFASSTYFQLSGGIVTASSTFNSTLEAIGTFKATTLDFPADSVQEADISFTTACGTGNHYYLSGTNLACEADADTTYTAGNGISLAGGAFSVAGGTALTQDASGLSVTANAIGDTQLAFDTGQTLTTTANPTFGDLTLTYGITAATGTFSGALVLPNNAIDEVDINFTTSCASGNRLYISGTDLACEVAGASGGSNWKFVSVNAITATTTGKGIIVNASSTFQGTLDSEGAFIALSIESRGVASSTSITVNDMFKVDSVGNTTSTGEFVVGADGGVLPGCLAIRDNDSGGFTYCSTLNGTINCGTVDCSGNSTSTLIIGR